MIIHIWCSSHITYIQIVFQFVFLPECCDYVGNDRDETLSLAETLTGETVQFYKKLAKEKKVWLSLGGIHEIIHDQVRTGKLNKLSMENSFSL